MDLSIITVNFNDKESIFNQIASVKTGVQGLECEQIISDNGSADGSLEEIKTKFPEIKIVENGKNLGFGEANNRAAKLAKGEFILFLNPDMLVLPGTLKKAVDFMRQHPEIGILGPKLVDEAGNFNKNASPRRFPKVLDMAVLILKLHHIFPKVLGRYLFSDFNPEAEQQVDSVRGSFLMMRRDLIEKLGFAFDPRYFIWFEDVDTCREAKKLGYKVQYWPEISCIDKIGQSFKKQPAGQKQRWFTESMVKYFKKWESAHKWIVISALRPVGIMLADISSFYKK